MTLSAAGLASAISAAQGPAQDPSIQDAANQKLAQAIISYFLANAVITIPPGAINTVGSAAAQSGPPSPVLLSLT